MSTGEHGEGAEQNHQVDPSLLAHAAAPRVEGRLRRPPDPGAEWWAPMHVATYIGVSLPVVLMYRRTGKMPAAESDSPWRWRPATIIAWQESRARMITTPGPVAIPAGMQVFNVDITREIGLSVRVIARSMAEAAETIDLEELPDSSMWSLVGAETYHVHPAEGTP